MEEKEADGEEAGGVDGEAEEDGIEAGEEGVVEREDKGPEEGGGAGRDLVGEVSEGVEGGEVAGDGLVDPGVVERKAGAGLEGAADDGDGEEVGSGEGKEHPSGSGLWRSGCGEAGTKTTGYFGGHGGWLPGLWGGADGLVGLHVLAGYVKGAEVCTGDVTLDLPMLGAAVDACRHALRVSVPAERG